MEKINDKINQQISSIVRNMAEYLGIINEKQATLCIIEAIKSGDFYQEVELTSDGYGFSKYIYKPYIGIEELRKENKELKMHNSTMDIHYLLHVIENDIEVWRLFLSKNEHRELAHRLLFKLEEVLKDETK